VTAYVCVYLHRMPRVRERKLTEQVVLGEPPAPLLEMDAQLWNRHFVTELLGDQPQFSLLLPCLKIR
jgi:hypothetical protein